MKSKIPFASVLFVFDNHSDNERRNPRTIVTPQLVNKQVIMLVV